MDYFQSKPNFLYLQEQYKIDPKDLELIKNLGQGSFGLVGLYKDKLTNQQYAVKEIFTGNMENQEIEYLKEEFAILSQCKHQNIIKFHGYFEKKDKICYLMDVMQNGNLKSYIKAQRLNPNSLSKSDQLRKVLKSVVSALLYIQQKFKINHRDIKSENILIDQQGNMCLSDFGTIKYSPESVSMYGTIIGTPVYMAPELIDGIGHKDVVYLNDSEQKRKKRIQKIKDQGGHQYNYEKCDVFSLGLTLLEILNIDQFNSNQKISNFNKNENILQEYLQKQLIKEEIDQEIKDLLTQMVKFKSKKRPSLSEIFLYLENQELLEQNQIMIDQLQEKSQQLVNSEIQLSELKELIQCSFIPPLDIKKSLSEQSGINFSRKLSKKLSINCIDESNLLQSQVMQFSKIQQQKMQNSVYLSELNLDLEKSVMKKPMQNNNVNNLDNATKKYNVNFQDYKKIYESLTRQEKSEIFELKILFDQQDIIYNERIEEIYYFCRTLPVIINLKILNIDFNNRGIDNKALNYLSQSISELQDLQEISINLSAEENSEQTEEINLMEMSIKIMSNFISQYGQQIDGEQLEFLAESISKNKSIQKINIDFYKNKIDDKAAEKFIKILTQSFQQLKKLQLNFKENQFTESDFMPLIEPFLNQYKQKLDKTQYIAILI